MIPHLLESERLILRVPQLEDAPIIESLINHREIAENTLSIPYPYPENGAKEWLRDNLELMRVSDHLYIFAIIRKADNQYMGAIDLRLDVPHKSAETGYWLGIPYWGQGYTTEALKRLLEFGFHELDLRRIWAGYFVGNEGSKRVQEKAGMRPEGIMRQHYIRFGVLKDLAMMSILRHEYEAQQA